MAKKVRAKKKVSRTATKRTKAPALKVAALSGVSPIGKPMGDQGIRIAEIKGRDGAPNYHLLLVTGKDGKPVMLKDQQWGEYGSKVPGADSYFDGLANTEAMLKAGNNLAKLMRAHGADCYLPSLFELQAIGANNDGLLPLNWFWSSTQDSSDSARCQDFEDGDSVWYAKGNELHACVVRRVLIQ